MKIDYHSEMQINIARQIYEPLLIFKIKEINKELKGLGWVKHSIKYVIVKKALREIINLAEQIVKQERLK